MSLPASGNVNFPNLFDSLKYKGTIIPQYNSYLIFLKKYYLKICKSYKSFCFWFTLNNSIHTSPRSIWREGNALIRFGWGLERKTLWFSLSQFYIFMKLSERFLKMNNSIQYIILYVRQLVINLHLKWIKNDFFFKSLKWASRCFKDI